MVGISVGTVSYTHLDVYKRQPSNRMADARKMYADLMGSPSPEPYGKMCKGGKALLHIIYIKLSIIMWS